MENDEGLAAPDDLWRVLIERALFACLEGGAEGSGVTRVRCDACRREDRVALSRPRRGFLPLCHAKRAVPWAERLTEEVFGPVSHDPWVLTCYRGRRRRGRRRSGIGPMAPLPRTRPTPVRRAVR